MRRSHRANTLILVADHTRALYDDKRDGDSLLYTGMGRLGNQSVTFMQNKTLSESPESGIEIHLFEVQKKREYTYRGKVFLAEKLYTELQRDEKRMERSVWIFPLQLLPSANG